MARRARGPASQADHEHHGRAERMLCLQRSLQCTPQPAHVVGCGLGRATPRTIGVVDSGGYGSAP